MKPLMMLVAIIAWLSFGAECPAEDEETPTGMRITRMVLEGFTGFNTGTASHPENQMVGYSPFMPVQLDADSEWEWLVKEWRSNHWPSDQHWCPNTHHATLHAFDHDGKALWTFHQGNGAEIGYGYAPVLAWDVDGDGIDEIFCRVADDPKGQWPGKIDIKNGHEWLVRLDPATGKEVARCAFVKPTGPYDVAARSGLLPVYLDGATPSIAMVRAYFTGESRITVMSADLKEVRWTFAGAKGQGAHVYNAADLDGDGNNEILIGCAAINHDGRLMWDLGLGHCDTSQPADFLPDRPGLEVFISGSDKKKVVGLVDGSNGAWIWRIDGITGDSQGAIGNFDVSRPGLECLTSLYTGKTKDNLSTYGDHGFFTATGERLSLTDFGLNVEQRLVASATSRCASWNADGSIAMLGAGLDLPAEVLAHAWWPADITGDWREEMIGISHGVIIICAAADVLPGDHPPLRDDRQYRQGLSRGPRGFGMSHGMRSNPSPAWPLPDPQGKSPADRRLGSPP